LTPICQVSSETIALARPETVQGFDATRDRLRGGVLRLSSSVFSSPGSPRVVDEQISGDRLTLQMMFRTDAVSATATLPLGKVG
jgi:hypothetical protein